METSYRELFRTLDDAIVIQDVETLAIVDVNDRACELLNAKRDEIVGADLASFCIGAPPWDPDTSRRRFRDAASGGSTPIEQRCHDRAGRAFWAEIRLRRARLGSVDRVIAIVRDITERRSAQESLEKSDRALRESRAFLEKAQEVGHMGSWISGLGDDATLAWSKEVYRIFGVPEQRPVDVDLFFSLVHEDDRESIKAAVERAVAVREPYAIEHRIVRPDGQLRWVVERGDVVQDASGPPRLIGVVQDVTERKHAEEALRRKDEQLLHAQKMEAVGRLAGGIAHDFNNLLTAIASYTELAHKQADGNASLLRCIDEIRRASDRAAALTRQLLAFSRKQLLQPRVLDLNRVVSEMEQLLRRLLGEDIQLATELDPDLARVRADPGQVEQVLANLVVNARDAMPRGGRLTIATRNAEVARDARPDVAAGSYAVLSVTDTGVGMSAATRARLFEPFFTTKEVGKGTGLGLSTVYGIVSQSGGAVTVQSELDRGATFEIWLPRAEGPAEPRPEPTPDEIRRGGETLLLVEDDDSVRVLTRSLLEEQGYRVIAARDGEEALTICQAHSGRIHLMVTDVVMPGLSGPQLFEQTSRLRPDMKVLFVSGYTDDEIFRHGLRDRETRFLPKPFTPDVLAKEVRRALEG